MRALCSILARLLLSSILVFSPFSSRNSVRERPEAEEEQVLDQVGPASPKEKVCAVEIGPFFTRPVRFCRVSVRQAHRGRKSLRKRTKAKKRINQRTGGKEENEINPWAQCCSWRKGRHALGFPLPSTQFHLSPAIVVNIGYISAN